MEIVPQINRDVLEEMQTNLQENLNQLTFKNPVMLVFIRHFGCVFCKAAMADIAAKRTEIESGGVQIVFVHMSDSKTAKAYFDKFKLPNIRFINDAEKKFYREFGLVRGSFTQLFGLQTWIKGYQINRKEQLQQESGQHLGDSFQMPGVFLLRNGEVVESFIHQKVSDRPDYEKLAACCMI
ncbi:MAG: peroxiredoxin [Paraglaciecola sp.]|jgi:peroxiredoxin